jgi:hypothetical protein
MSDTQTFTPAQGARWMAKQGVPITPLNGKIPFGEGWQDRATNDVSAITELAQSHKGNYGCVAKKGEFWMVDEDKVGFFERFTQETGLVLDTLFVNSSAGRRHGYFQATAESDELFGKNIPEKLLGGAASVRWHNQQCVCPFSVHPTHKTPYLPVDIKATIKPAPVEFIRWILAQVKVESKTTAAAGQPRQKIEKGGRDHYLFTRASALRAQGLEQSEIETVVLRENQELCVPPVSTEQARKCIQQGSAYEKGDPTPTVTIEGKLPGEGLTVRKEQTREERKAAEVQSVISNLPTVSDIAIARVDDMPEDCLIGALGEACISKMRDFPRAYSWLTLVIHAAQFVPQCDSKLPSESLLVGAPSGWRQNLYFAPVGLVHSGKSVAGEYSRGLLGMDEDAHPMVNIMPGSAEGLLKKIADASGGSRLVNVDELGFLMERSALEGASFPYIMDRSYYKTAYSLTTGGGKEVLFNCRLSVLGGVTLPKEGAYEGFGDLFGSQSVGGMYDRFLLGLQPSGQEEYAYLPFSGPSLRFDLLNIKPTVIGMDIWEAKNAWVKQHKLNPRVTESCIRVAGICASYEGKSVLSPKDIEKPVVALAKYQSRLRLLLQPNTGKNDDGKLSSKFRSYLKRHSPNGEWLSERVMLRDTNAYDFGVRAEKVLASLEYNKEIERSVTSSPNGGPSKKVIRLTTDSE